MEEEYKVYKDENGNIVLEPMFNSKEVVLQIQIASINVEDGSLKSRFISLENNDLEIN